MEKDSQVPPSPAPDFTRRAAWEKRKGSNPPGPRHFGSDAAREAGITYQRDRPTGPGQSGIR